MKTHYLKLLGKTLVLVFVLVFMPSCSRVDPDSFLYEGELTISPKPTIIVCKTPLRPTRESNAILLVFSEDWSLDGTRVKLKNGNIASLKITLVDNKGNEHTTGYYGQTIGNGIHGFRADFSDLQKGIQIVKVEVTSSVELKCQQILWHCYDPI